MTEPIHSSNDNPINPPSPRTQHSTIIVGGATITVQQLQQIFSEITGKTETLSKYYDDPICLSLDDVENVHHRIMQTWEQYQVQSTNFTCTIYYLANTKDQITSFERLKLQSATSADPVESILLKYDILLLLPNVPKAQSYSISIRLISRLALQRRMRDQGPVVPLPRFIRLMAHHTGSVEIAYIDYSVARSFMGAIDEWFRTIPRSPENKIIKATQPLSHWIPRICRLGIVVFVTVLIYNAIPHFIKADKSNLLQFGKFILLSSLGIYVTYMCAGWLGSYAEHAVDSWSDVSYIKFNRGDEAEIKKSATENRNNLIKVACGIAGNIVVGAAAKIITAIMVAYL